MTFVRKLRDQLDLATNPDAVVNYIFEEELPEHGAKAEQNGYDLRFVGHLDGLPRLIN